MAEIGRVGRKAPARDGRFGGSLPTMLSSLDAAYTFTRDTPRNRQPEEAHWKLNRAYFDLIFAWAYAQAGNAARSGELLDHARAALPVFDPVHQTVLRAFELRIRDLRASPWTRLDIDLSPLESIERYRVMRLFEALAILSRVEFWDAIGSFWRQNRTQPEPLAPMEDVVTQVLVADGEGRLDDVRAGLDAVFASEWVNGAVLLGPCRRVGREAQLIDMVKRHQLATPSAELAVALEVLGVAESVELEFEQLGPHRFSRLLSARKHIGALVLSGRTAAAEKLAAYAWREASDSFNTNESFSISALGVCETIVLSVLRHELAPGSRNLLEPLDPSLQTRPVAGTTPTAEAEDEHLVASLERLASTLREVAALSGSFQERFRQQHEQVRSLLEGHQSHPEDEPGLEGLTLLQRIRRVKCSLDDLSSMLEDPGESLNNAELTGGARRIVSAVAAVVEEYENRDPAARASRKRIVEALNTVQDCLRSCVVERPTMPRALLDRISETRAALGHFGTRHWVELPFEDLVELIARRLEEANRDVSSLPEAWDPEFAAGARKCVTLATAMLPYLRG